jgi:hypothetical protein
LVIGPILSLHRINGALPLWRRSVAGTAAKAMIRFLKMQENFANECEACGSNAGDVCVRGECRICVQSGRPAAPEWPETSLYRHTLALRSTESAL